MYTASVPPEHKSAYTYMHSLVLECALEFPNTPLPMIGLRAHGNYRLIILKGNGAVYKDLNLARASRRAINRHVTC